MLTETNPAAGRPRVTVAALVEREGRFLFVEEQDDRGQVVINQPAGHVEAGESLIEAMVRETFEETGWQVLPQALVGTYLWGPPDRRLTYLRVALAAMAEGHNEKATLDEGILRPIWLSRDELFACRDRHRSELVLSCVDDYLSGERYPLTVLKSLLS